MKRVGIDALLAAVLVMSSCNWTIGTGLGGGRIIDHSLANVANLSQYRIDAAKQKLDIVYWHTSHGSQLTTGMAGMDAFFGETGRYAVGGPDGLRLEEPGGTDLGVDNGGSWEPITRAWLGAHTETNVVIWSWCGQVSGFTPEMIDLYLRRMTRLEVDFPDVRFVYMTGHSDGTGLDGNLHQRDMQIRAYCEDNGKFLFDFYDIECYDPDGVYYGDRHVTDGCVYDGGRNWAEEWQAAHPGRWWDCESAHSEPLNANLKAMAAWQLWVRVAESL